MAHYCTLKQKDKQCPPRMSPFMPLRDKFCRSIRLSMLISSRSPRSYIYYRTNTAIENERCKHLGSKNYFIVHPFSTFRMWWEIVMAICLFMYLMCAPVKVAFEFRPQTVFIETMCVLCSLFDLFFIADIVVTFYTGFTCDRLRMVILDHHLICINYGLSFGFLLDVVSSLPTELLSSVFIDEKVNPSFLIYLDIFCLMKIFRLRTLFSYLNRISELIPINDTWFVTFKHVLLALLVVQWCGCVQIIVPEWRYLFENYGVVNNRSWLSSFRIMEQLGSVEYTTSLYKASTHLLCISSKEFLLYTEEDLILYVIVSFMGYLVLGLCLVTFLELSIRNNTSSVKYHSIMNQLDQYMRHKQLPITMQKRLIDFYNYRFRKSYFREATINPILPARLKENINFYTCEKLVKALPVLKDLPTNILNEIAKRLKLEVFLPNDIIIKAGTFGDAMYFILYGTVAVFTLTGKEVCHIQDNGYFGEVGLVLKDQVTQASVIALEITEAYRLDKRHFEEYIKTHRDVYKRLSRVAEARRENTVVMEEIHRKHILEKTMRMIDDKNLQIKM